jgi:ABC-type Zn uptake system ZnuABC Zn-binding protein ZnuA/ABC-type Mn2+/Zn2+ transport system permease subunit
LFEPFQFLFVQRGLLELALLSVGAGLIGTWIVLRGLAFYSHAVGTAAFPGLVVADGLGFSPLLGAFGAAALFAVAVTLLARTRRSEYGNFTALVLVGALALGVILASDVFHSGANVETLLFGSLLLVGTRELVLAAVFSVLVLGAGALLGRRWLATGFDPHTARSIGVRSPLSDALLLALVGFGAIAAITSLGALLVSALLVVPAATTRLWTRSVRSWQLASVALVLVEGVVGIWISVEANVPPGAAVAVLAGGVFVAAALARAFVPVRLAAGAAALLALALLAGGCGVAGGARGSADISAVATTTQIGDWARVVGGSAVTVHQILRPNTDPHEYEPRPLDVEATARADVVLENGDKLDDWMSKVVSLAGGHPRVVDLGAAVPIRLAGESSGPESSRFDPHWWHDPRNAAAAVRAIRDAFTRAAPEHRALFERNAGAYLARLSRLDAGIAACVRRLPPQERKLVTDHDAFGYFARRYGLAVVGAVVPSQTTQAQPSAGDVADLVALVRRERVKAIFPESSLNQRLAKAIAGEAGASSHYRLYGDTLGPEDSAGATYIGMEAANADAIVRGLSGGAERCSAAGS